MKVFCLNRLRGELPLFILLVLAFAVRVYGFGQVPGGFNQDEAMAAYDAYALSLYGTDRFGMFMPVHFTAWGYAQMNVLTSYMMVPFIKLFGLSAVSARLPALLLSMLALYAMYAFVRDSLGKKIALAALAFAAINPWHIMQARWALECNLFPQALMIGFFLLRKGLTRERFLYLSMIAFALSMYAYGIAFYTVPLLLVLLCSYLLYIRQVSVRQAALCAGVYLLFSWPLYAVMLINYFQWPSLHTPFFTAPYFPDSVRMNDLLLFSDTPWAQFKQNFTALVEVVFLQRNDLPWNMIPGFGAMYRFFLPFATVGAAVCVHRVRKNRRDTEYLNQTMFSAFLLCWFGVALFSGLMANNVNVNRINLIYYPLMLFIVLGLYTVVMLPLKYLSQEKAKKCAAWGIAAALTLFYTVSFAGFARMYFGSHNETLSPLFYKDFYTCLVYAEQKGYDRLYVTNWTQYKGAKQVSEILTLYGLCIDPLWYQAHDAYDEKYHYVSYESVPLPEAELDAVYIFNLAEKEYFPEALFDTIYFDGYGVAIYPSA